ncbi:MAG: ABC transporter permease [Dermatophilaceae bacterium]|nr:ABC transporter permease [Dermatophilaceae bacterium]
MTATVAPTVEPIRAPLLLPGYRFEVVKLLAQGRIRCVLLVCLVVPAGFVAVISQQSALPTDTVFGRWMHTTGWAGSLVVLAFACSWGLPLLVSLVAGDVFAVEDRLGTWRHLLVAVRSPRRIFVAKALASLTIIVVLVVLLMGSSIVGGLAAVGNHPLVGLDGHSLAPAAAARTVLLTWLCVLAPTLAFAAVGLLGSVVLGRSPMGLLVPAVLALAMNLVLMLPVPVVVRLALPSDAFLAWRGLYTDPAHIGPLLIGVLVSLVWAAVATGLAYVLFLRRDFTDLSNDGAGRRTLVAAALPLAVLVGVTTLVLSTVTPASGTGIEKGKLERSLATAFAHLYVLQTQQMHRPSVTETQLATSATCDKAGSRVDDRGPGNDWRCVVTWRLPGATATGSAIYQLDVAAEGRYVADGDGPKEVNGYFQVRTAIGDAPNPLWQLDGYVDLLGHL